MHIMDTNAGPHLVRTSRYLLQHIDRRRLERRDGEIEATLPASFAEDRVTIDHNVFERYAQLCHHGRAHYFIDEVERTRTVFVNNRPQEIAYKVRRHNFYPHVKVASDTDNHRKRTSAKRHTSAHGGESRR